MKFLLITKGKQHKMWSWESLLMKCSLKVTVKRGLSWQLAPNILGRAVEVSKKNPRRAASWSPASSWVESQQDPAVCLLWGAVAQPSNFWERYKSNPMEERECFQQTLLECLYIHRQENEPELQFHTSHLIKIISTKITDLHIKGKTIALLEESRVENSQDLECVAKLLELTSKQNS